MDARVVLRLFNSSVLLKLYKQKRMTPLVEAAHIFIQTAEREREGCGGGGIFAAKEGHKTTYSLLISLMAPNPPPILGIYLKAYKRCTIFVCWVFSMFVFFFF